MSTVSLCDSEVWCESCDCLQPRHEARVINNYYRGSVQYKWVKSNAVSIKYQQRTKILCTQMYRSCFECNVIKCFGLWQSLLWRISNELVFYTVLMWGQRLNRKSIYCKMYGSQKLNLTLEPLFSIPSTFKEKGSSFGGLSPFLIKKLCQ